MSPLIDDARIKGVALTGSGRAGQAIAGRAGRNLKKSTMELGGSDAFVVLKDAPLEETVRWAIWGKMNNMGQCCEAAKRCMIVDAVADAFLERFKAGLSRLVAGDPIDADTTLGPLRTEAALVNLLDQIDRAVAAGEG